MKDAFGVGRDEHIVSKSSRSEKRESVALGAGALAGVGGATAVDAMNDRDKAKAAFKSGKFSMKRATKAYGHAPNTRAHYRGQGRAQLARSGHLAARSKKTGLVAAGLLGGAGAVSAGLDMTRGKKEVSKAFTGFGTRALRARRGVKQGLKMAGTNRMGAALSTSKAKAGGSPSGPVQLRAQMDSASRRRKANSRIAMTTRRVGAPPKSIIPSQRSASQTKTYASGLGG